MTNRERVIRSLQHKESDIIPFDIDFTQQEREIMAAYTGDDDFEGKLGRHMYHKIYSGRPVEIDGKPEFYRDDFGVIWNRTGVDKDIGVIESPCIPDLEDRTYVVPSLDEERLRKDFVEISIQKGDNFSIAGIGFSLFERAWSLCGMEETLMGMVCSPVELERLLDDITDRNIQLLDIALEYDVDGIYFGDDWGQQKGLIMGVDHWRRFLKPRIRRMYAHVKKKGKFILQHSCGDIQEIYPDLIDMGLDCHQTFQPEIYDIAKIKKEFGQDLSFWGGISTQQLLPNGTPEQVRNETIRIMRTMGVNGGYIAAPTHSVPCDVPPENILAMMDVFHHQEKYLASTR